MGGTPGEIAGSTTPHLVVFDCITCDKCLPVCPNDANFAFTLAQGEVPVLRLRRGADGAWATEAAAPMW